MNSSDNGLCAFCNTITFPGPTEPWTLEHLSMKEVLLGEERGYRLCAFIDAAVGLSQKALPQNGVVRLRHEPTLSQLRILVQKQPGGETVANSVRLAHFEGSTGKYIALSYCWGKAKTFVTSTQTLHDRLRCFSIKELPQTLRDAVEVAQQLGVTYLWVDVLCILQGSDGEAKEDWEHEAGKMGKIYGNAYLTLSAAASRHCDGGLFYRCVIPTQVAIKNPNRAHTIDSLAELTMLDQRDYKDEPIVNRAWTLQEGLLSQRNAVFCLNEVCWHCDLGLVHQSSATHQPNGSSKWHNIYKLRLPTPPLKPRWTWLVQNYCGRNLTKEKDKLPAIAGLAAHIYTNRAGDEKEALAKANAVAKKAGISSSYDAEGDFGEYLAGLWRNTLWRDLLWRRTDESGPWGGVFSHARTSRPLSYRAPSWSWASMDGMVTYIYANRPYKQSSFTASIVDCNIDLLDPSAPFSEVKGGRLVLRSLMKQSHRIGYKSGRPEEGPPELIGLDVDEREEKTVGAISFDDDDRTGMERASKASEIQCLQLALSRSDLISLILLPVDSQKATYARIGICITVESEQRWWSDAQTHEVTIV
ncbi:HET-domain-containing protein [Rhizodiscina lignyota]|uniref:HET-domain-containing protein n=1 Tax=Rhizodiscina lignyota TaxID=1504668 RepID=A0A9P4M9U1_9PEZI|nr:HET-domain-containing protein [Rhizodiscina lignyota]